MNNPMRTLLAIFSIALFAGCGQMGPLYNPAKEVHTSGAITPTATEPGAETELPPESTDSGTENDGN